MYTPPDATMQFTDLQQSGKVVEEWQGVAPLKLSRD